MRLGDHVLELLKKNKLKQIDLANYLGTKSSTISGWKNENRNPSSEMIIPICEFLDITPTFLFTGKNYEKLSAEEEEWLDLYKKIPFNERKECIGYLKGYIAHGQKQNSNSGVEDFQKREASGN